MKSITIQGGDSFPTVPSSFSLFFAPILPRLADFHWDYVFIEMPPETPMSIADEYLQIHSRVSPLSYIPPNTYLPRFADYVSDGSWHTFRGFRSVLDPESFFTRLNDGAEQIPDLFFQCIDGGPLWEFGARDGKLVDAVVEYCGGLADVICRPSPR